MTVQDGLELNSKEHKQAEKIKQLRQQLDGLDYNQQSHLKAFFLTWLHPLISLGKITNLTYSDIPIGPYKSLSKYTKPILYATWNETIERLQKKKHQTIHEKYQQDMDAYQLYRQTKLQPTINHHLQQPIKRPRDIPQRLQNSIPLHVHTIEELRSLPVPKPFTLTTKTITPPSTPLVTSTPTTPTTPSLSSPQHTSSSIMTTYSTSPPQSLNNLEDHQQRELMTHISTHPAITVLDNLYDEDKLPIDLPPIIEDSSNINNTNSNPNDDTDQIHDDLDDLNEQQSIHNNTQHHNSDNDSQQQQQPQQQQIADSPFSINDHHNILAQNKEPEPFTAKVILSAFKNPILLAFLGEMIFISLTLSQPLCIKLLSRYFTRFSNDPNSVTSLEGIWFAFLLSIVTLGVVTSVLVKVNNQMNWASRSTSSYLNAIMHKILRVAPYSISRDDKLSIGSITNLTSQDAGIPFGVMIHMLHVVSGPFLILMTLIILYFDDFGSSAIITMAMMLFLIPYQAAVAKLRQFLRYKWLAATDKRIKYTLNLLSGLRVAKLYSWEPKFQEQLQQLRDDELHKLRAFAFVQLSSDIFTYIYPLIVTYLTLAHYVSRPGTQFSSAQIVVLMAYLNSMRLPIQFLGQAMQSMIELYLSGSRIGHFLSKEELPIQQKKIENYLLHTQQLQHTQQQNKSKKNNNNNGNNGYSQFQDQEDDYVHVNPFNTQFIGIDNTNNPIQQQQDQQPTPEPSPTDPQYLISMTNCDLYWSSFEQVPHQTPVLSNITLQLQHNELVSLIGLSGAGKSALLQSLFGDLYPQPSRCHQGLTSIANFPQQQDNNIDDNDNNDIVVDGMFSFTNRIEVIPSSLLQVNGRIAYCSQTPWLMNDTIRNNIIMDCPFDSALFKQVIDAAALKSDLEVLPNGDLTIASEQGINLSGGQAARVQFAKALYHALSGVVDIILLDDIFAAVDGFIAQIMFEKGVCGILKKRCGVIMVLNSHYEFLQHSTRTLLLDHSSDTYWLLLHQYIITKQAQLINKKTAKHILMSQDGNLEKSYSILSRGTSSLSRSSTDDDVTNHDNFGSSMSFSSSQSQPKVLIKTRSTFTPNSNPNPHGFHQTPLVTNPPLHNPISPDVNPNSNNNTKQTIVNPSEIYIDPTQMVGFRQPSTIAFAGSIDDLMAMNLPLLSNFVYSQSDSPDDKNNASNGSNMTNSGSSSKIGHHDEAKELEQSQKLVQKIEGHSGKGGTATPTQAQLPSWLYLYWFQGSRGKFGLWAILALFVLFSLASQAFRTGSDVWLIYWAADEQRGDERHHTRSWWLTTTALSMFFSFFFFFVQVVTFLYVWLDASRHIHKTAIGRVLKATIGYLDITPLGQIINKVAGKDVEILDSSLPDSLLYVVQQALILIGIIFLSCLTSWVFVFPLIPFGALLYWLRKGFHNTSVQVKRIESANLSPIYSLFNSVTRGASVIRAYGQEKTILAKYSALVDKYIQVKIIATQLERHFAFFLNTIAISYVFFLSTAVILARNYIPTDLGMLAITYSIRLVGLLQMTIRFYTATTQSFSSIHRITQLNDIPQEREYYTNQEYKQVIYDRTPLEFKTYINNTKNQHTQQTYQIQHLRNHYFWPWRGKIEFKNITLRYRPELPIVINNLSLCIDPGESIAIIGPSGSGKSTISLSLFSILIPEKGTIEIDGVDIFKIGISDLRSRLSLVPQTPTVFSGTIRSNLDPLGRHNDNTLWQVLEWVSLTTKIKQLENGLDSIVDDGGTNFSQSERQLLCIGRALLTQVRDGLPPELVSGSILVSDEATASIPNDELVNTTISNAFQDCTRIVIAHRLQTVIDLDKILVLRRLTEQDIANNESSILEFDIPFLLLNTESEFKRMCMAAGEEVFVSLYQAAKESYFKRILPRQTSNLASQSFHRQSGSNGGQGLLPIPVQTGIIFPSTTEPIDSQPILNVSIDEIDIDGNTIKTEFNSIEQDQYLEPSPSNVHQLKQSLHLDITAAQQQLEESLTSPDVFAAQNALAFYNQQKLEQQINQHSEPYGNHIIYDVTENNNNDDDEGNHQPQQQDPFAAPQYDFNNNNDDDDDNDDENSLIYGNH